MQQRAFVLILVCCLSACNGDDDSEVFSSCTSIAGGGSRLSREGVCNTCGIDNEALAGDGQPSSFATVNFNSGASGSNGLRVTAQDGIVYAAGTMAYVINSIDYTGQSLNTLPVLQTYLDGVLQESKPVNDINGSGGFDEDVAKRGFATTLPYDAIEFLYQRSGGIGAVTIRIYEFCTR